MIKMASAAVVDDGTAKEPTAATAVPTKQATTTVTTTAAATAATTTACGWETDEAKAVLGGCAAARDFDVFSMHLSKSFKFALPCRCSTSTKASSNSGSVGGASCDAVSFTLTQLRSLVGKPGVTGASVWDSAVVLGGYLLAQGTRIRGQLQSLRGESVAAGDTVTTDDADTSCACVAASLAGLRCVELGAGCGLAGLCAARAGASVLFTDLPDYLDLLQGNIASCLPPSDASRCMVSQLDWFNVSTGVEAGWSKPDLIVAADCVYKESDIGAFVTALKALAVPGRTLVVLALEVRQLDRIRLFLQQAEAAGFTVVVEASFSASPSAQHTKLKLQKHLLAEATTDSPSLS